MNGENPEKTLCLCWKQIFTSEFHHCHWAPNIYHCILVCQWEQERKCQSFQMPALPQYITTYFINPCRTILNQSVEYINLWINFLWWMWNMLFGTKAYVHICNLKCCHKTLSPFFNQTTETSLTREFLCIHIGRSVVT